MKETDLTKFGIEKYDPHTWYFVTTTNNDNWLVRGNLLHNDRIENATHVQLIGKNSYYHVFRDTKGNFTTDFENIRDIRLATKEEIDWAESHFGLESSDKIKPKEEKHISIIDANQAKELYNIGFEKQKQIFMADIMYRINTVFGSGFKEVEMYVGGFNQDVVKECVDELKELGYCVKQQHKLVTNEHWIIVILPE